MADFEIVVNGELLPTMKGGEFGSLAVDITWTRVKQVRGTIHEDVLMLRQGLNIKGQPTGSWPFIHLRAGDEVRIRIV